MPSDQLYITAKLYGAARLNIFSRQFVEAQEQLKDAKNGSHQLEAGLFECSTEVGTGSQMLQAAHFTTMTCTYSNFIH